MNTIKQNIIIIDSYNSSECELNLNVIVRNSENLLTVIDTEYSYLTDTISDNQALDSSLKQKINSYFKQASFIGILEELAINNISKQQIIIKL
jgi:hypothetical protein